MNELISGLVEAWNSHDAERVTEYYADDYEGQDVAEPGTQHGTTGIRQSVIRYLEAFPDIRFTATDIIEQDSRAVFVWSAGGTHKGKLLDIPASGRHVFVRGVTVLTVRNGKIARALNVWDLAGLLRDIALLPDL
jgi:steroid delta-isomerase-like uncharacterized protein